MSRETWEGKRVRVRFDNCPAIQGVVKRTPADTGDTWYIVREADPFTTRAEYAVQTFAYIELIE